jgi:signal transduction histidine kinase
MLLGKTSEGLEYVFERPVRILVVDDDPIMLELASTQLSQPGSEVATAKDGEEALELLDRDEAGFDLILSDLEMPRMNGFALVDAIRRSERLAHLPVVVITSRDDMFAIDRAYEVGATSFVAKPVNWRLLGYQLRYVMRASRMEAEVRVARDEARRAADLRESLLALLQHETRTPLHGIIGYAGLLKDTRLEPSVLKDCAEQVVGAAEELNDKLRRIFYYAQVSTGGLALDRESVALSHVVGEAVRSVRARAAAAKVAIAAPDESGPSGRIRCDLRHFAAALQELLHNAVAHCAPGSTIEIGIEQSEGCARLSIRDHGTGIPADVLRRCREPFGQGVGHLTRMDGGLGLGLPLAQRIIELHGGVLELSSANGSGTSALVVVPLLEGSKNIAPESRAA